MTTVRSTSTWSTFFIPWVLLCCFPLSGPCQNFYKLYEDSVTYYYKNKNVTQAVRFLDKLIEKYPTHYKYYLHKAHILNDFNKDKEVIKTLTVLLDQNPSVVQGYIMRAIAYLHLEKLDSSVLDYTTAIGRYPEHDSVAYRHRGYVYYQLGEFQKSMADYDSALKYKPTDPVFFMNRALTRQALGNFTEAIEDVTKVIDMHSANVEALRIRAFLYLTINDLKNAFEDSEKYLKKHPDELSMKFLQGQIFLQQKLFEKAITNFDYCSNRKMVANELYLFRGIANYYLARDEKAIDDLQKFLKTTPNNVEALFMIGVCRNNLKPRAGCEDLRKASKLGMKDAAKILLEDCN